MKTVQATNEEFYPTKCPTCKRPIFFGRRSDGLSYWVDHKGPPWETHACFARIKWRKVFAEHHARILQDLLSHNVIGHTTVPVGVGKGSHGYRPDLGSFEIIGLDGQRATMTAEELRTLPNRPINVVGEAKPFAGLPLFEVLTRKISLPTQSIPVGTRVVVANTKAAAVEFTWDEIDPCTGGPLVCVAARQQKPEHIGMCASPFRIVIEGEPLTARCFKKVSSITLRT